MNPKATLLLLIAFFTICSATPAQLPFNGGVSGIPNTIVRQPAADSPAAVPAAVSDAEHRAFNLLNAERAANGLPELVWSDRVAEVARRHSENMAKNDFFSHQDLDGLLVNDRADRAGLSDWTAIGENIAYIKGFKDPCASAITNWMHSTAHRENLLSSRWKVSAIGVAITDSGIYYFTQVFIVRK